jgi:hypothetical protein
MNGPESSAQSSNGCPYDEQAVADRRYMTTYVLYALIKRLRSEGSSSQ